MKPETVIRPARRADLPGARPPGSGARPGAPRFRLRPVHGAREDALGEGVATQLVEAAASELERRGAPRIMLWTAERNAPARRLFERLGFRPTMVEMTREVRR